MRYFIVLILCQGLALCPLLAAPIDWEERTLFKGNRGTQTLRVISSTDTSFFSPIIERFLVDHPALNVEYLVAGSTDIYEEFRHHPEQYDVVISSAMDLQLKLVNDGYGYRVPDVGHPDWAQWRESLFGFTLEAAGIVVNKKAFAGLSIPQSRQEMIEVLRKNPDTFRGRIGTYDVQQSGLGYLFATQDARTSDTYWRLMEIMGSLNTRLYCCSGEMIDDVAKGTIAISYNVLGSYAMAREDIADKIEVILPSDFPTTMMRTVLVVKETSQPRSAIAFLKFLTSSRWSDLVQGDIALPASPLSASNTPGSIISLGPGLMIFLDSLKRKTFLEEWRSAIIQ